MEQTEQKYGVRKATPAIPERDLLVVPHRGRELVVSHPAFGPDTYANNVAEMGKPYTHSAESPAISFREPTTSESISASAYEFPTRAKPEIFDPRWLQAGRIARTSEGVFANQPRNVDEKTLKSYLAKARNVNGIWLLPNGAIEGVQDFGFAPYESFQTGVQDCNTFAEGGLGRVIEHAEGTAVNLRAIASPKNYKRGVNVGGFEPTKELAEKVLCLSSYWGIDDGRLFVGGYWNDYSDGYCFGVRSK